MVRYCRHSVHLLGDCRSSVHRPSVHRHSVQRPSVQRPSVRFPFVGQLLSRNQVSQNNQGEPPPPP